MMYDGKLVRLRAYKREDIDLIMQYINNSEIRKLAMPGILYPLTLLDEEKWFESISGHKENYSFAIDSIKENLFIGGCSINEVDWKNRVATIGIIIGNSEYWGGGYGTDAIRILCAFIFNQLNMNKINLKVYSYNHRAIKSYEKCGFVIEGKLRSEVYCDGQYFDSIVMGLLKSEFSYDQ